MTQVADSPEAELATTIAPRVSRWRRLARAARRHPVGVIALILVVIVLFLAAFGGAISADPNEITLNILQKPSSEHWFGTDGLGRDYFARVISGARASMSLSLSAMLIGGAAALLIGMVSAYAGGFVDLLGQRLIDMLLAFPELILLLLMTQVVGRGWEAMAVGLGFLYAVDLTRIVRSNTLATLTNPYVESAKVVGASPPRILIRHVLPNMGPPALIYMTALIGGAILAEGALSFLGLGIAPPTPSWGRMLADGRTLWREWHLSVFPGVAMTVAVLGFNLLGDTLRDVFDPRLRGS
jgi:peptide/nickel transport system permease protein